MPDEPTPLAAGRAQATANRAATHPLLTVPEAARMLRVSPMTVRRACDSGDLPTIRVGRVRRIARAYLQRLLDNAADGTAVDLATTPLAERDPYQGSTERT